MRPLAADDIDAARELLRDALPTGSRADALTSLLESAALAPGDERRALAAEVDGRVAAVVIFGEYAGAAGAGRLHLVAVDRRQRRRGIGTLLLERAISELGARGARFVLTELPLERPALDGYVAFLAALGFTEESRIEDFHRPGVPLVFSRRELRGSAESA